MSLIADVASLLYTVNEAALLLNIHRSTVYTLMNEGIIPWEEIAGRRLMHETDLRVAMQVVAQRGCLSRAKRTKNLRGAKHAN